MPILTPSPITRPRVGWLFSLLLWCGIAVPVSAQCTLSCSQGLQVSLDPSGQALITPQIIAPNAGNSCPGPLTITLYNAIGQVLPNPLTCNQIGQVVSAQVKHTSTGNSCTGTLELFDALPPTLSNCSDKFIFCNEDPAPAAVGMPGGSDNCTAAVDLNFNHFDTEIPLPCGTYQNGKPVLKRIDRNWTVSDDHGNPNSCVQKIWLKHITFADVQYPLNRDNISAPALSCGQDPEDLNLTGEPTVNGVPVGASPECEIAVTYSDQTIFHCAPAGFTLLRTWTAIDFCSGTLSNRIQIIRVEDKEPPVLTAPPNITVGTDGFYCTGTVTLPPALYSDNCSSVTLVPSWEYGTGFGPFSGITKGVHVVTYTATDACGNSASATMTVTVVDSSPPQAICASNLQISLSSNGLGYVNAGTVDQGSFDNCGPVFLSISRDELNYSSQILVSCADQGIPLMLTLKVTDAGGLENFCQMEISVRDFLKPNLQCPPNLTLNCLQDYKDMSITGQASASDNCGISSLVYQDFANIQPCNIGSVTRWWTATDSAANTKTCIQSITINAINTTTVNFPANTTVASCGSPSSLLPITTGQPTMNGQSCSPLSVNYEDLVFSSIPPACFRIFRHWKVVDHCIYNPNGGTLGIWEHTQVIDVVDHTAPLLSLPADVTVAANPFDCTALITLPDATASDCSSQITFSNNSPYSTAGSSNNASGSYPLGIHDITFTATDACGNATQQTLRITVKDLSAPQAVCLTGVTKSILPSGTITLDPQWFDGGCADLCSPQNSLIFSISPAVFDCQQIGLHLVTLTIKDPAGNTSSCNTQVTILDPAHVCNGGGSTHQIEGKIRTETGVPVHDIPVSVTGEGFIEFTQTDSLGIYRFYDLEDSMGYVVTPFNNANWLNGVTTYDLVLISKHILGTAPLDSPYKILAADANRSGSVTTYDVVQLRKLILGIVDSIPSNNSWRFVDSSFVFPDPQNPFSSPIPEERVFSPLVSNQSGQNFIGLKVGDVNGSTDPAHARTPQDTLVLKGEDLSFSPGESFNLPVYLDHWSGLEGLQFELEIDPDLLEIQDLEYAQPELLGSSNVALKPGGILALSWDQVGGNGEKTESRLFTLHLRAKRYSDVSSAQKLRFSRMKPEAYLSGSEQNAALQLQFEKETNPLQPLKRLYMHPNPNSGKFWIQNPFPNSPCYVRICDVTGKTVWEQSAQLPAELAIEGSDKLSAGVYWVEWTSNHQHLMGKVVVQ